LRAPSRLDLRKKKKKKKKKEKRKKEKKKKRKREKRKRNPFDICLTVSSGYADVNRCRLANRRGWIVSTHVYDPAEGTIDRRIGDRHYLMPSLDFVAMDVSLFFISRL